VLPALAVSFRQFHAKNWHVITKIRHVLMRAREIFVHRSVFARLNFPASAVLV
jgi:hypothetical protein